MMVSRLQLSCVCCFKRFFIEELPSALQLTRHPPRDQKISTTCRGMCSGTCAGQVWTQLNPVLLMSVMVKLEPEESLHFK